MKVCTRLSGRSVTRPARPRENHSDTQEANQAVQNATRCLRKIAVSLGMAFLAAASSFANPPEKPEPKKFTLSEAVAFALKNYPSVRAAIERIRSAHARVGLESTNYLPTSSLLWQSNRGTANNIYGLLLPQGVLPPISGPVLASTTGRSVWGSGAGVLFSWEPFDFGYRHAEVDAARAGEHR